MTLRVCTSVERLEQLVAACRTRRAGPRSACAYFTNIVLRAKKYRKLMPMSTQSLMPLLERQLDAQADRDTRRPRWRPC